VGDAPRRTGGGFPPTRKSLGQHFLSDPSILGRIADALAPTRSDTVIEIGPGRGALTDVLAGRAGRVIAIELDRALAALLRERYAARPSVEILEADVLETNLGQLADGPYLLAGNVPYYITTPILFHALRDPRPARAVYLVQREVAERIVAAPGEREYGALSVNVQALASAEVVFHVPAGAFHPPPKVDSSVIRITPRTDPIVASAEEGRYRAFVQEAFGLRRKQMRRVIRTIAGVDAETAEGLLAKSGIAPDARPETVGPEAFARLLRALG
jgi:16S rRNA (adenine1518-N6/adenine1519-N6)-dimethyltransferase